MTELCDQKLITLVQATGDADAFSELVKRHRPALLSFLKAIEGNDSVAEEAAQESLLLAYTKLGQFRFASSFRTWLFRIAYRERARLSKKNSRREDNRRSYQEAVSGTPDRDPNLYLDLEKALRQLSEQERSAIVMCDAYGFSHSEAADFMNAPLGSVKTYVRRARQKMLAFLDTEQGNTTNG